MPYHRADASFEERVAASLSALRVIVVVLGLAFLLAVALAAWGFLRADDATSSARAVAVAQARLAQQQASLARQTAQDAKAMVTAQRASREQNLRDFCVQQNTANGRIVRFLTAITPVRKRRATPHFGQLVRSLADAFDPRHRDCGVFARAQAG